MQRFAALPQLRDADVGGQLPPLSISDAGAGGPADRRSSSAPTDLQHHDSGASSMNTNGGNTTTTNNNKAVDIAVIKQLALPIIPGRLYFTSLCHHPASTESARFFTIDYDLYYSPYFADFGPLNMGMLIRFCRALRERLNATAGSDTEIFFYSSQTPHLRANAAFLIAGFAVLVLNRDPAAVIELMSEAYPPLLPFRDASYGVAAYKLTIADTVHGLHKAKLLGWIDVDTFAVDEYEKYDEVCNGDWNWVVPGKLIAFSSPVDDTPGREAKIVLPAFKERGVSLVVRLNEKKYDRRAFTEVGVRHEELQYPDGSTPPDMVVRKFLDLAESQRGAIAVHCKAGLGRTGTLLCIFMMKHYGLTAKEAIAWCRICRPGSVIGPQQQYLDLMERRLNAAGDAYRRSAAASGSTSSNAVSADRAGTLGTQKGLAATSNNNTRPSTAVSTTTAGGSFFKKDATAASAATLQQQQPPAPQQQQQRAQSPARRSKPTPLRMIENLPFEAPGAAERQRVVRLQQAVGDIGGGSVGGVAVPSNAPSSNSTAAAASQQQRTGTATTTTGVLPRCAGPAAATLSGPVKKATTSTTGVSRATFTDQGPVTYIAGVTAGVPHHRLLETFAL